MKQCSCLKYKIRSKIFNFFLFYILKQIIFFMINILKVKFKNDNKNTFLCCFHIFFSEEQTSRLW